MEEVPLVLTDIGIHYGLMGYRTKSSTFCHETDVVGLSAFYPKSNGLDRSRNTLASLYIERF